jgi:hypothetical protein
LPRSTYAKIRPGEFAWTCLTVSSKRGQISGQVKHAGPLKKTKISFLALAEPLSNS